MNADTITTDRIETLAELMRLAWERISAIAQEAREGDITTDEAAAEINEIIANINAANS